jgi:hypothetical protein
VGRCQRRYGVDFPSQDPDIADKFLLSRYLRHSACLQGKEFIYQGYEGHVLGVLVNQLKVPAKNIYVRKRDQPKIWWFNPKRNKDSLYYPDIRIKYKNKDICIEVKSLYTVGLTDLDTFKRIKMKAKAADSLGIDLRVWVVNPKTKHITRISNFHELTWKELQCNLVK